MNEGKKSGYGREYIWNGKQKSEAYYNQGYPSGTFVKVMNDDGTIRAIGPIQENTSLWLY